MSQKLGVAAFAGTLLVVLGANHLLSVEQSHPEQCRQPGQTSSVGARR